MPKAKALKKRRYRPVSEFDEATLACKREYWRTQKREQRAKMSMGTTSPRNTNTRRCKRAVTTSPQTNKPVPDKPHSQFTPAFPQSGGSFQNNVTQKRTNACHFTPETNVRTEINQKNTCGRRNLNKVVHQLPENNADSTKFKSFTNLSHFTPEISVGTEMNQKDTWCERINLNKVVNQFPENNTNSTRCKSLIAKESNVNASMVKLSGLPPITNPAILPVPRACVKVHANITETRQIPNRPSAFNGSFSSSSQQCSVSRFTAQCNQQKRPQIKICVPPRSSSYVGCKVNMDQQHILAGRPTIPNRTTTTCAYVPECNTTQDRTTDPPMTEEEQAAKRREIWRIKKREQRAKRAEKLKKDKEKSQCFGKGQQEIGKLSCVAPTRPLLSVNTIALRRAKLPNSVKSVGLIQPDGRPAHFTVKYGSNMKQSPYNRPLPRVDTQVSIAKNFCSVPVNKTNHILRMKPVQTQNHLAILPGVSFQGPSGAIHVPNKRKIQPQRLMHTPRRQSLPQQNDSVETPEERHAKQKEYWRIKKRLQRARLAVQVKAHMRDALKQCTVRNQGCLDQPLHKTPTGVFQRDPQPNRNLLGGSSQTVGQFIEEDGTISILEIGSPATSCASACAVRSSYPTQSNSPSAFHSQKLVRGRGRSSLHGIGMNRMNYRGNLHQRYTGQMHISTVNPVVRTRVAKCISNSDIPKGLTKARKTQAPTQEVKAGCRRGLRSSDSSSSSGITASSDLAPQNTVKEEPSYPLIDSVYSLAEPKDICTNSKDIKAAPSPPPDTKVAKEVSSSGCDNQATTLLVVASMQKLLEESLSSVVETCVASTSTDVFLPCKIEEEPCPQETEASVKPDPTTRPGASGCKFAGSTDPSIEVKQSSNLCHSPPQAPDFSAEDTVISCPGSLVEIPCPITAETSGLNPNLRDRAPDLSVAVGVRPGRRGTQANSVRRGRFQQACGGQQQNERSELQKKREYWRIMKRKQRAKKANETEGSRHVVQHKQLSQPVQRKWTNFQVHYPPVAKPGSHTNLNDHAVSTAAASRPTRLVLSPTESNQQSNQHSANWGKTKFSQSSQVNKWQLQTSALTSSIRPDTVTSTQMNHIQPCTPRMQNRRSFMTNLKNKRNRFKADSNQGLDAEEILRRKRMHWRIKKQEQRAKKAARERELSQHAHFNQLGPSLYNNIPEVVVSIPPERPEYHLDQCQVPTLKDEAELCFVPDDNYTEEPLTAAKWRNAYLMDYDPVNQLLVCMVCGEQQYCLSVEGATAHIEEAHPGTLSLEERERQRILQAWDEQVAMRERFFTNQLWQQSGTLQVENTTHTAEIEVTLDAEDIKQTKTRTS
ncbi:uncharacterized protein si:dkey-28a3.2 [Astyanax mexicanus]|uniref:uncharacterized protein si:dkey-28a3.2 n=1 Tax=Astyanax mexicanus TaxID=7994 RepID=UPI0020CB32F8|nr:uncharacterized protein si:dkey-28a3.2 [Astyanax mexicanus]